MLNLQAPSLIYSDKPKALRRMRLRLLCIALPIALLYFILSGLIHLSGSFIPIMRWVLLAEIPILYFLVARALQKQTKPIVSLSSQGITVHTLCTQVGFLRWDEIKDVYTYNLGYRLIGITLNDPKTVYRRLGLKRSWMLRANGLVAPLYKPFRVRVAPINIPQEYLPMSADELLVQIQTYRDAYS